MNTEKKLNYMQVVLMLSLTQNKMREYSPVYFWALDNPKTRYNRIMFLLRNHVFSKYTEQTSLG